MAIVHIAVFEVVNALSGAPYQSYLRIPEQTNASMEVAVATAAHDTLVAMFPSQAARLRAFLVEDLRKQPPRRAVQTLRGMLLGRRAANAILSQRADDGSDFVELGMGTDFIPSDQPGWWRQDPISLIPIALGAKWGEVTPFVLAAPDQFRAPAPPALSSTEYAAAYHEVRALGGDGITTPTLRTEEQTRIGIYWAYDGTPSLCAPPRLYNQLALEIARVKGTTNVVQLARMFALVNVAMADAGIAIWESKFLYQLWRPITGIRESDPGTGPTGLGDGNDDTAGDTTFSPLGAPASNGQGPNFTPPFPAYPSGHAGFGGALFQVLRRFYRTDDDRVHVRLGRVQRRDARQRRRGAPARFRAASRRSHRPRRRTARVGSTSASTGRSTRRPASHRAARSATTSSTTCTSGGLNSLGEAE